jgi:hypothetical protein
MGMAPPLLRFAIPTLLVLSSAAQPIGPAPQGFQVDGRMKEWPAFSSETDGFRFAQSPLGLVAVGSLSRPAAEAWKIEVRVSLLTQNVEMPPIGFFPGMTQPCVGPNEYNPVAAYRQCLAWVEAQKKYRNNLRSLFERRWTIRPTAAGGLKIEETLSSAAWASLTTAQQAATVRLKPSRTTPTAAVTGRNIGNFEILLPWESLPPTGTLHLERVRLSVRVYEGASIRAATDGSASPYAGPQSETPAYALFPAISFQSSACGSPLAGTDGQSAYALIRNNRQLLPGVAFRTVVGCCGAISVPREEWLSPAIHAVDFVEYPLQSPARAEGDWLCGPNLAWRRAGAAPESAIVHGGGATIGVPAGFYGPSLAEAKPPQIRQLPNGIWLVRDIPDEFSRIQSYTSCAACPWRKIAIYSLSPKNAEIRVAFAIFGRMDLGIEDLDAEISPDWSTITSYRFTSDGGWTASRFCLAAAEGVYRPCNRGGDPRPVASAPKSGFFKHP